MKPARIILLVVALVAGGLAAFLVTRGSSRPVQQVVETQTIQEARTQVLVAKAPIGMGERLGPAKARFEQRTERMAVVA